MFLLKYILLTLCSCIVYASESSEELENFLSSSVGTSFLQTIIKRVYDENKLDVIDSLISEKQESIPNITLIGSQNIYGQNGEILEIRTVELHIPQIYKSSKIFGFRNKKDQEDVDDDDDYFSELKDVFDIISRVGFSLEIIAEEYNQTGDVIKKGFINKNLLYGYDSGVHLLNKTLEVESINIVNDKIKELQKSTDNVSVAIHKFDAKGQFLSEQSTVIGDYIVSVVSEEGDVDQEMLEIARQGLAEVYLKYQNNKDEVPERLSEYLASKYPKIDYNVFSNEPIALHVKFDFKIKLRYDLTNWDNEEDIIYFIIGLKREDIATNTSKDVE